MKCVLAVLFAALICVSLAPSASASPSCAGFDSLLNVSEQTVAGATSGITFGDVCVTLTSSTTASITFTALNNYLFLAAQMADVQVNAGSFTLGTTITESPHASLASDGGSNNVNGYGVFNQTIDNFDGAADAESTFTFTLTNNRGTWASAANVLAANTKGFDAAAHVICKNTGTACDTAGSNGGGLTFFVAENAAAVPEPRFYGFLVVGLMGVVGILLRRRRTQLDS